MVTLAGLRCPLKSCRSDDLPDRLGPFDADELLIQAAVEVGQAVGVDAELIEGAELPPGFAAIIDCGDRARV